MWKSAEGSTLRLIQLCIGYFVFYVITGVTVRYFQFDPNGPGMSGMVFLTYSTFGGTAICLGWVIAFRWFYLKSNRLITWAGITFPSEFLYIIPSGVCTAVIIPTTTLMYSFKHVSVMVAMVIMRGSVIVISRFVDSIQIRQGILTKKVYAEENWGVVFALLAVGTKIFGGYVERFFMDAAALAAAAGKASGKISILQSPAALTVLCSYVCAYALRIYIMNYYKNTRPKGQPYDNKGFFAIEQIAASTTLALIAGLMFVLPTSIEQVAEFQGSILTPHPSWFAGNLAGAAFGIVAFFSVFIFMFKGRTATFAGLVNRLTSLVAGTAATLLCWQFFGGKFPQFQDWLSLMFIFIAVGFMTAAERKRSKELAAAKEIEEAK
ncbi:MAG: hypothetical protein ABIJ96_11810 [Elusimicrobiota bacterium]